ncbi:UNVERIFIED_CONTAM: hypothetical protein Sangu_3133400 [Sesamum angustifolium]|uniref:Uncharacterized protein n=1 Tax=Sesamum angustifolium TaxID=2727405 RepID=A0AAW2K0X6_9LAMI
MQALPIAKETYPNLSFHKLAKGAVAASLSSPRARRAAWSSPREWGQSQALNRVHLCSTHLEINLGLAASSSPRGTLALAFHHLDLAMWGIITHS